MKFMLPFGLLGALCALNCGNYNLLEKLESPGGKNESCGADCRIFVTSASFNGNLGGIPGADQRCRNDPTNPAPARNWKAIVSSSPERRACSTTDCSTGGISENIDWVLKPNTVYRRTDGVPIGVTTSFAIFSFVPSLNAPISTAAVFTWTGLAAGWLQGSTCGSWADGTTGLGAQGDASSTGSISIFSTNGSCPGSGYLYCAEQ